MARRIKFPMNKELRKFFQAIGHLGGLKGGKATAKKMTPEQRSERAKKAAHARWKKRPS